MPNDALHQDIRAIILDALGAHVAPTSFSTLLHIPLTQPGKILHQQDTSNWVRLVLAAASATGGDHACAARVAAAIEIVMAGYDVLDEVEDGDDSPTVEAAGTAQAINVGMGLLLLGQRVILELPEQTDRAAFAHTLARGVLTSTGGQHRDLASALAATSADEALATARQKSGALAGMACRLGALTGTADPALLALYERWGTHFGTAAQLANDLHDATNTGSKSDLALGRGTLPLVYFGKQDGSSDEVTASGALQFTWVVLEIERQHCAELLDQLAARGQGVAQLRDLLGN